MRVAVGPAGTRPARDHRGNRRIDPGRRRIRRRPRGVAALARAGDADRWAGTVLSARQLTDAYGITDTDGRRPDCWGYLAAYGWERDDGAGIDDFR
jgi:hypothetical protein